MCKGNIISVIIMEMLIISLATTRLEYCDVDETQLTRLCK